MKKKSMKTTVSKFLSKFNKANTLFIIGLIALTVMTGYTYGKHDQALYIPLISKILNPDLYTRDAFAYLINNEAASFLKLLAPFFRIFGVETGFFILYYIGYGVLVFASYLIGKFMFNNRNAGYVLALLVMSSRMPILTPETFFATRALILPLLLIAVYFFIKSQYKISYFLIGVLANFHQISALSLLIILAFIHLAFIKSIGIKKTIMSGLLFLLGFTPTIVQILMGNGTKIILTIDEGWYKFQRILTVGNYGIFYPEGSEATATFLFILFGAFSIFLLLRKYRSLQEEKYKQAYDKLSLMILFTIIFELVVAIIYRFYPIVILVQLQLIRASSYLTIFSALGLGVVIYLLYINKKINIFQGIVSFMLFYFGLALLSVIFLLLCDRKLIPKLITYIMILIGLASFVHTFQITRGYISWGSLYNVDQSFINLQDWMRNNTPVTSLFLAPTNIDDVTSGNIRVISQRNILFTPSELWMDIIFYKGYKPLVEVLDDISHGKATESINEVNGGKLFYDVMTKSYIDLTASDVLKLKEKYGIDYFIVEAKYRYDFNEVFSNDEYRVYRL
ncbi:MAG: hypothetical protein ABI721_00995 [Candidatus Dojkabacteria bacterium]